jgi:hypothetical protein
VDSWTLLVATVASVLPPACLRACAPACVCSRHSLWSLFACLRAPCACACRAACLARQPTVQLGSIIYDALQSCMRVMRLNGGSGAGCNVQGEVCCEADPVKEVWQNIWSMQRADGHDFLLTQNPAELTELINSGWGSEICNSYAGNTDFCTNQGLLSSMCPLCPSPTRLRSPLQLQQQRSTCRCTFLYRPSPPPPCCAHLRLLRLRRCSARRWFGAIARSVAGGGWGLGARGPLAPVRPHT